MNSGTSIFNQLVDFLPKRTFDGIVKKYIGDRYVKTFTCWNPLLVMTFGQLPVATVFTGVVTAKKF